MNSFLSLRFAVMVRGGGKRFRNRVAPPRRRGVAGWSKQHIGPRHHGMRAPVQHVVANFTICDIGTPQLRVVCRASSRLVAVGTASGYTASTVLCAARTAAGRARVHVCVSVPAVVCSQAGRLLLVSHLNTARCTGNMISSRPFAQQ